MNSKVQSNIGVGQAIAYFTGLGYSVSIPLTESQRYDLVVDDGENLHRVEVKTTTTTSSVVELRTKGGNQTWSNVVTRLSKETCDLVFCYSIMQKQKFLFPIDVVEGKTSIKLYDKYEKYRVD